MELQHVINSKSCEALTACERTQKQRSSRALLTTLQAAANALVGDAGAKLDAVARMHVHALTLKRPSLLVHRLLLIHIRLTP